MVCLQGGQLIGNAPPLRIKKRFESENNRPAGSIPNGLVTFAQTRS